VQALEGIYLNPSLARAKGERAGVVRALLLLLLLLRASAPRTRARCLRGVACLRPLMAWRLLHVRVRSPSLPLYRAAKFIADNLTWRHTGDAIMRILDELSRKD